MQESKFDYVRYAAILGDAAAQIHMGNFYMKGQGVEQNLDEAFKYYKLAADQRSVKAWVYLAAILYRGKTFINIPDDFPSIGDKTPASLHYAVYCYEKAIEYVKDRTDYEKALGMLEHDKSLLMADIARRNSFESIPDSMPASVTSKRRLEENAISQSDSNKKARYTLFPRNNLQRLPPLGMCPIKTPLKVNHFPKFDENYSLELSLSIRSQNKR